MGGTSPAWECVCLYALVLLCVCIRVCMYGRVCVPVFSYVFHAISLLIKVHIEHQPRGPDPTNRESVSVTAPVGIATTVPSTPHASTIDHVGHPSRDRNGNPHLVNPNKITKPTTSRIKQANHNTNQKTDSKHMIPKHRIQTKNPKHESNTESTNTQTK